MAKKWLVFLLVAVMIVPVFALSEEDIVIKDMMEREIKLAKPVERLVVMWPGDCEIIYALGAQDLLVGLGSYCDYPEEAAKIEKVAPGKEMNIEQVIALKPDMVITTTMSLVEEHVQALENAGVKVLITNAAGIEGVYDAITLLGEVTGKKEEAKALVDQMKAGFADVQKQAEGKVGGTAYYEVSPLDQGLWAAGGETFMDEIGQVIGLKNIFADQPPWAQVSEEQVIKHNPDVIISTSWGETEEVVKEIVDRAAWQDVSAIQNQKVFRPEGDLFTRPGPRLVDAAQMLFDLIYGVQAQDKAA